MAFPTRFWAEMTWTDFRDGDMASAIAVLPVAAIEQHGPHLPVGVDTFIMEGYLRAAVARFPDDLPALVLPVQAVGKSNEHLEFPGTLTFSAETVIRAWREIRRERPPGRGAQARDRQLARRQHPAPRHRGARAAGPARPSGGGGELEPLRLPRRALRRPARKVHGIHAGEAETSLMMAFRPELVRHEALRDFVPNSVAIAEEFAWLRVTQPVGFGWMAQDVSAAGGDGRRRERHGREGRGLARPRGGRPSSACCGTSSGSTWGGSARGRSARGR